MYGPFTLFAVRNILNHDERFAALTLENSLKSVDESVTSLFLPEQWVTAFSKYTNNTYTETDSIFVKDNDLQILALSLKSKWLGAKGLNYLVAWNVYTRLVNFTLPYEIGQFLKPSEVCYDHTGKAMRLALLSPYLEREASPSAVEEVKKMLSIIRNAFSREFETSSWVVGEDRRIAISKLANLRAFVGSPGQRIAPYFVERLYLEMPFLAVSELLDIFLDFKVATRRASPLTLTIPRVGEEYGRYM
ncbi:hypothetical protein HPB51_010701 [Rhipicephalus microplus]|uniref:Peptidase M13 N-terminal domain-containing protein n=1 Tax=Rhipicephalus microplus TaxID=6941 RepID=A0A9J6F2X6_RHIMP|nr:hypothetical protein HPB51_010701 [Rhipicephalus microplus]